MSESTIRSYKKGVWEVFAVYIKARDSDINGIVKCCSCPKKMYWRSVECQAGHYVPGRTNNILFDEQLVHGQCSYCNEYLGGNQFEYSKFMMDKYRCTFQQLEGFHDRKRVIKQFKMEELKALKKDYKILTEKLILDKGLSR